MQNSQQVTVINTFQISKFGIIVFLRTNNNFLGLENGTILKSENSSKSWYVENRIIEFPSIETNFENEKIMNSSLHFTNVQNRIKAEENAIKRSNEKIYLYQIDPILHNEKPKLNEILNVITFDKNISENILKILLRELKFHSENGNKEISNIGYLLYETSKMTGTKTIEVMYHINYLTSKGYIKKNSNDPLIYSLTEKGKNLNNVNSIM